MGAAISRSPCWHNADVPCEASHRRFTKPRGCRSPPRDGMIPLPWCPSPKSVDLASTVTTLPGTARHAKDTSQALSVRPADGNARQATLRNSAKPYEVGNGSKFLDGGG